MDIAVVSSFIDQFGVLTVLLGIMFYAIPVYLLPTKQVLHGIERDLGMLVSTSQESMKISIEIRECLLALSKQNEQLITRLVSLIRCQPSSSD